MPADFYGSYAREFQRIFPQTQTGINNLTPVDAMINTTIYGPQANTNGTFTIGSNFASQPSMEGLTYSFDYDNARFVLIDQFTKPDGTSHSNLDQTDVDWVGTQLCHQAGEHPCLCLRPQGADHREPQRQPLQQHQS